uniref:Uncharacterized protein n=2 Tax=Schistocephalus solidus TaxID=70667 RepID=A0A0X3NJS6_SCHSO
MEYFLLDGGPPPAAPAADFYLLFLYRLARGKPKYTWLHDGRVLQFTQPQEAFAYPLFFRSPSSSVCCLSGVQTVAGSYQLIVSSFVNGRRDPVGSLNFTALVRVLRPARLSCTPSSLASPLLLAEGFPFEVRCEVTPVSEDLQISAELQSMLTGQRTSLDFWHDPSVRTFVVQTAEKKENTRVVVFHKRECSFADGDFRFLLWARNLWGAQYADIVARVFPLPAVTLAPRAVFCSTLCDPSVIEISFKDRLPAVWRDNYAIYPSLSWLLVGRRNQTDVSSDPDLRQFFHVDYDNGSSLRLLPDPAAFNASDLGSLLLAKGLGDPNATTFYLQLRIQLFWDPSEDSGSKRLVVYDTATARIDPALRVLLTFGEKSEEVSSWLLGTIIGALCLFLILLLGLLLLGLLLRRRQSLRGPRADFPDLSPRPEISYPLERPETPGDDVQPETLALLQHPFAGKQSVGLSETSPTYATVPLTRKRSNHESPSTSIKVSRLPSTVVLPSVGVSDPQDGGPSVSPELQTQELEQLPASVEVASDAQTVLPEGKSTEKPRKMRVSRDRTRMHCRPAIDFKIDGSMSVPTDPLATDPSSSNMQHITEDLLMEDLDDLVIVRSRLGPGLQQEDSDSWRSITQIFLTDP